LTLASYSILVQLLVVALCLSHVIICVCFCHTYCSCVSFKFNSCFL